MKRVLLFCFFSCFGATVYAQCNLDLGPDIYACSSPNGIDSNHIGNGVVIQNTSLPVSYSWQAHHIINLGTSTNHLYASDLLDDTTSANPRLITGVDSVEFFLTITDSNGLTCTDSFSVYYSYIETHLAYLTPTIMAGDSVFCAFTPNLFGGVPPLQYLWRPNHGLRDSTKDRGFWAKPDSSINYYLTVTDSVGCTAVAPPLYIITVQHVGLDELQFSRKITAFPNPTIGIVTVKFDNPINESIEIEIFDISGRLVKRIEDLALNEQLEIEFSVHDLSIGTYNLSISSGSEVIGMLKLSRN